MLYNSLTNEGVLKGTILYKIDGPVVVGCMGVVNIYRTINKSVNDQLKSILQIEHSGHGGI
ncbi:MAG: hypothetical protein AB8B46_04405 [Candidatus Midichloriaceae bacterium]